MPDFSEARVGDRVWVWRENGREKVGSTNATIIDIEHNSNYPISIQYDYSSRVGSFTIDGLRILDKENINPALYWSRPQIIGGDVPQKRKVKYYVNGWTIYNPDIDIFSTVYRYEPSPAELLPCEILIHIHHEYEVEE